MEDRLNSRVIRNREIVACYLAGESIVSLARTYEVSRQRIFEIVKKSGAHRPRKSTASPDVKRGTPKPLYTCPECGTLRIEP